MSALLLPSRMYSQPQGEVEINRAHPLAPRLSVYILPRQNEVEDVVSGKRFSYSSSNTRSTLQSGVALGTTGRLLMSGFVDNAVADTSGHTWLVTANPAASATQMSGVCQRSANATAHWEIRYNNLDGSASSGAVAMRASSTGSAVESWVSAPAVVDGKLHTYAISVTAGGNARLLVDGVALAQRATGTRGATGGSLTLAGLSDSTTIPFVGDTREFISFYGALSDDEIKMVTEAPWQLLKAPVRRLYFGVPTTGLVSVGGVLVPRWNALTSTSKSAAVRWNALTTSGKSSALRWNALTSASKSTTVRWNALTAAGMSRALRWNMVSSVAVGADFTVRWSLLKSVASDATLRWDLRAAVARAVSARWDLLQRAGLSRAMRWSMTQAVTKAVSARWNLTSLAAVSGSVTLRWGSVERVGKNLLCRWSVGESGNTHFTSMQVLVMPEEARVIVLPAEDSRVSVIQADDRVIQIS